MSGAECLVGKLVASGIEVCFANPGTSEMHFVAALDKISGMRAILLLTYQPKPLPLIDASEARNHLRGHLQVKETLTEIESNRRCDLILLIFQGFDGFNARGPH